MLNQMRTLSQTWIGRSVMALVLGFIILSFAVWGIGDRFTNFNANELAKVGGTSVSVDAYRNAYQRQLQGLERSQKRAITNEEARALGLDRNVFSQVLRNAMLDEEAKRLGLAVGDAEVAKSIKLDATFKGPNGQFDNARFQEIMRDNGLSEQRYVHEQRVATLRQDVADLVTAGLTMPDVIRDDVHAFQASVRDFSYFVLPPSAAGSSPAPTDTELQSYYDDHPQAFTVPEYRKLNVLSIVPANLVKPDAVTDAEVKKRYDEMKTARFSVPEKRTLAQLVYPDEAAAKAAKTKADGGASFDALIADQKKTAADAALGTVAKGEVADPAVADAAFALPDGATSAPIKGAFGWVLVHVAKIEPAKQQPLTEVSGQLKDEVAIVKARAQAADLRTRIENDRTAGKTLAEASAGAGLKTRTIEAIDAKGLDKAKKPVEGLVDGPVLLKAAFASDVGADNDLISAGDGSSVWFEVTGIEQAHREPLDKVRPQVAAGWAKQQTDHRLAEAANKLVAAIDAGKTLESAAAEAKAQVMIAKDVTRGGAPSLPSSAAAVVFAVATGKAGSVADSALGRLVFKVTAARVPPLKPDDAEFKKLIDQVQQGFEDDLLAQYLAQLQAEIGVRINQRAYQTALGSDNGS